MSNLTLLSVSKQFDTVNSIANDNIAHDANNPSKVNDLAKAIQLRKFSIAEVSAEIKELEAQLLMICGVDDEGSRKFNTDEYVITTTGKLTRSIKDLATLKALAPQVVRVKEELDLRKFKKLATDNPMLYGKVVTTIETKSAKPAIKIEPQG